MDSHHLQRLKEEQQRALNETDSQLQQLNKFHSDYAALQARLRSLPDKTTHEVMVPLGSLAFMPGQLVHTNEILVLLGDNYFVERSASQAVDIVLRRMKELDKNLESLQKQRELLLPRAQFTSDMINMADNRGEQQEIVEPFDEEEEKQWRERHRHYLRQAGQKRQEAKADNTKCAEVKVPKKTEEDMWERLHQLELQEEQGRELEDIDDECDNHSHTDKETVSYKEREDEGHDSSSQEETDNEEEDVSQTKRVITFSHTKIPKKESVSSDLNDLSEEDAEDKEKVEIQSPADIYRLVKCSPRSILKTASSSSSDRHCKGVTFGDNGGGGRNVERENKRTGSKQKSRHTDTSQERQEILDKPVAKAFTDTVVERPAQDLTGSKDLCASSSDRPVSKFRAAQQKSQTTDSSIGQDSCSAAEGQASGSLLPESPTPAKESTRPMSRFRASRQKQTDTG